MSNLHQRLADAFDQLTRYGGEPVSETYVAIVELLTDVNDDAAHGRHPDLTLRKIQQIRHLLDVLEKEVKE